MKLAKLGTLASIQTGKIDVNRAVVGGRYPFFTCSRDTYEINDAPFEGKAVLVAGNGDLNVKYYEGKFNAYQRTYFLFVNNEEQLLPRFLYWFLESYVGQLRSESVGSTIKYIKMGNLTDAEVPLLSIEKQREIVEKLDSAFADIDLLEGNLELSDEKASQLLQSILSSAFAPVDESNLSANQGSVMNENYKLVRLGNLCDSISGLWTGKKPPFEKATVIRNTNFTKDCKLDLSNVAILDVETKQLQSRRLIQGDLIVEKSGGGPNQPVGRVVLFNESVGNYSLSNFTSALRVKNSSQALPKYLQHFLYYQYVSGVTETMQSNSTGIRNLNIHQFLDIEVPLPSLDKQAEIVEKLDSTFAEIQSLKAQIRTKKDYAASLRQSLLSSFFSREESVA